MPRVAKPDAEHVRKSAQTPTNTVPDGYVPAAEAAEAMYQQGTMPVLQVEYRLRRAAHAGRIRYIEVGTKRWMYHRGDVIHEAQRLTKIAEAEAW